MRSPGDDSGATCRALAVAPTGHGAFTRTPARARRARANRRLRSGPGRAPKLDEGRTAPPPLPPGRGRGAGAVTKPQTPRFSGVRSLRSRRRQCWPFRRFPHLLCALLLLAVGLATLPAHAHKPSDSYLTLQVADEKVTGQWDVAIRDLDFALGLDGDDDGSVTWGELKQARPAIEDYLRRRLQFQFDGQSVATPSSDLLVDYHTDGAYVVLRFAWPQASLQQLTITYHAFFELDPQHRGLLRLATASGTRTAIFGPDARVQEFELRTADYLAQSLAFVRHGIWHIWIGYDHILFLLALLLPAMATRANGRWQLVASLPYAGRNILKIVTAFTVAHSVTLALASCGVVRLPSRWVESIIAASVVVAALLNLLPRLRSESWKVAFGFGLIHGFGFAEVLGDLGLQRGSLALGLTSFNVGVELGQLAIVLVFIPALYQLRRSPAAYEWTLQLGSLAIAAAAVVWTCERAFEIRLLQF